MENRSGNIFGVQEVISLLKEEKKIISEQMRNYNPEDPDQSRFAVLLRREEAFNKVIKKLQDLIEPERGGRMIGQDTLRGAAGPEPNRFKGS